MKNKTVIIDRVVVPIEEERNLLEDKAIFTEEELGEIEKLLGEIDVETVK